MQEELNNFKCNKVLSLVERPKQNIVGIKYVFCNKKDDHEVVIRNKARLIAKGYSQVKGLEFDEIFASVVRLKSIRMLLAYATHHDPIKEEVYVEQPLNFESEGYPNHIYKLYKTLYGLKQAPRAWYECLRDFLIEIVLGLVRPTLLSSLKNG
jgi:hypothetical protein